MLHQLKCKSAAAVANGPRAGAGAANGGAALAAAANGGAPARHEAAEAANKSVTPGAAPANENREESIYEKIPKFLTQTEVGPSSQRPRPRPPRHPSQTKPT
jgi:hypothetical protein